MTPLAALRTLARTLRTESCALYLALRDPRTPRAARWLGAFVLAYALSPLDLIPDFIPVLGLLDDALLLPLGVALVFALLPDEVKQQARAEAEAGATIPRGGMAAVIVTWALLLVAVGLSVWRALL